MPDVDRTTALADRLADAARAAGPEPADRGPGERAGAAGVPRVVEVGIGARTAVAAALADRGLAVTATDVVEREVPDGIAFVRDDLTDPDPAVYRDAALLYALRLPPELHRPFADVAREAGGGEAAAPERAGPAAAFTTLGGDPPAVPSTPEQLPGGETLFWVSDGQNRSDAG